MSTEELTPIAADEANANSTTTLALTDETAPVTTVVLERQRIIADAVLARRDLHGYGTKAWKELNSKYEQKKAAYDVALDAWKGKKLMQPQMRIVSKKRRIETLKKKEEATVERICDAVEGVVTVKDRDGLTDAVTAALATPASSSKSRKKPKTARVEEEESD